MVTAYNANLPPWRDDAASTFTLLQNNGINLHFISNSSTDTIQGQLKQLKGVANIPVNGGAAKYRITELTWDPPKTGPGIPPTVKKLFADLPAACTDQSLNNLGRPVYLRRGSYFESIWTALGEKVPDLSTTVFCGDIWELDLAMPYALGANIHFVERAGPFDTYPYERQIVTGYGQRGKIGPDLASLLEWL